MLDPETILLFYQGDDVETDRQIQVKITDIGICRRYNTPDLFIIDSFFGRKEIIFRAGFHLYDNQILLLDGNNIQFVMMPSPVGMQNRVALTDQIIACPCFTIPA